VLPFVGADSVCEIRDFAEENAEQGCWLGSTATPSPDDNRVHNKKAGKCDLFDLVAV
jgi:hypothetical protein